MGPGGIKMSKSKGNVINPDDVVKQYGADTLRVYEMFMGPFEQMISWDQKGIIGARRFLEKIYNLAGKKGFEKKSDNSLKVLLNKTIKKVSEDIELMKFNTAISSLMEFANALNNSEYGLDKKDLQKFLIILSPFAPHLSEEIWEKIGFKGLCSQQKWPKFDSSFLQNEMINFIIQINGKVRDKIKIDKGLNQKQIEAILLNLPKTQLWLKDKKLKKVIFIPDKLINIVL